MKLSVIMPAFNEENFIRAIVEQVLKKDVVGITSKEIIIVDDGSTDKTRDIIETLVASHKDTIKAIFKEKNSGKGSSIRLAVEEMTGDICIIQDADLEYSPDDYDQMLEPIIEGRADCVYGSRFMGSSSKRVLFFWHFVGNKFITLLSNMCTNLNLSDIETCYKAFRCEILKSIPIRCKRFGFEPEITSKIAKRRCRIFEVGISYNGRTYEEGKKIMWIDGIKAIYYIFKFCIVNDSQKT